MHDACSHTPVAADVSAIHSVASLTQMRAYSSGPGRHAAVCAARIVKQSDKHVEYNYSHYSRAASTMLMHIEEEKERKPRNSGPDVPASRLWIWRW